MGKMNFFGVLAVKDELLQRLLDQFLLLPKKTDLNGFKTRVHLWPSTRAHNLEQFVFVSAFSSESDFHISNLTFAKFLDFPIIRARSRAF